MSLQIAHFSPHIGTGGLGEAISKLCTGLAVRGNCVRLHVLQPTLGTAPERVDLISHPRNPWFGPLGVSASLKRAADEEAAGRSNVLHVHSLWTMASMYPGSARRAKDCRLVHAPQGTLAAWAMAHHAWRKKIVWPLLQRKALARADCFMVTSRMERDDVRRMGFTQPVAIVHNGVDIPRLNGVKVTPSTRRRLLFLGRIHPVKAIDRLLQSWRPLHGRFPEWELVVAGVDDGGYLARMKTLAAELKLERVSFPGLVRENERDSLYQSADLFVLPSHSENFGIAAAEALANGIPAVISKHAPWSTIEREGSGWWTDNEPGVLSECLAGAMALAPETRAAMGARGREWMARDFSWSRAAEMTEQTYLWLLGGGTAPAWVD